MKPVMRSLSPETKAAIESRAEAWARKAQARGYSAGWGRGFRVGALLAAGVWPLLALTILGVAWVVG